MPKLPTPNQPLLTVDDVAVALQVSARTVRRFIAAQALESIRIGRSVRIAQSALDQFIRTQG